MPSPKRKSNSQKSNLASAVKAASEVAALPLREGDLLFIGVDPGDKGAIAVVSAAGVRYEKMPATVTDIVDLVEEIRRGMNAYAAIERITTGFQGTGKSAMAKLYGNYCICKTALIAGKIPILQDALPSQWQRALKMPQKKKSYSKTQWKGILRGKVQEMFPAAKVTMQCADAVLLAQYCRELYYAAYH